MLFITIIAFASLILNGCSAKTAKKSGKASLHGAGTAVKTTVKCFGTALQNMSVSGNDAGILAVIFIPVAGAVCAGAGVVAGVAEGVSKMSEENKRERGKREEREECDDPMFLTY